MEGRGRVYWTGRGAEDSKRFASSYKCAAGKELKLANYAGRQSEVWEKVKVDGHADEVLAAAKAL